MCMYIYTYSFGCNGRKMIKRASQLVWGQRVAQWLHRSMYLSTFLSLYIYTYMFIYIYIYLYMYLYIYIYVYIYIYIASGAAAIR